MNKADKARMQSIKGQDQDQGALPCLPCLLLTGRIRMPSVQHVVEGRKRLGHQASYASCEWHHFGHPFEKMNRQWMIGELGPSLAHGKRGFQEYWGTERLLIKIQNMILMRFNESPWMGYDVPHNTRREAQHLWAER